MTEGMEPWQTLAIIGLLLVLAEFFTPTFFFLPAGLAFFETAIISVFIEDWTALLLVLAVNLGIVYWIFYSFIWPRLHKDAPKTAADAMTGKVGTVVEAVDPNTGEGVVKLYGDTWRVVADRAYAVGTKVIIQGTDGNKVIITPHGSTTPDPNP